VCYLRKETAWGIVSWILIFFTGIPRSGLDLTQPARSRSSLSPVSCSELYFLIPFCTVTMLLQALICTWSHYNKLITDCCLWHFYFCTDFSVFILLVSFLFSLFSLYFIFCRLFKIRGINFSCRPKLWSNTR